MIMGADIHMRLIRKSTGFVVLDDLYDGRCLEWFDNLTGRGYNEVYSKLSWRFGLPDCITEGEDFEIYQNPHDYGGYNFQWIPAKEYIDWYEKYRPYLDAGYLTEWENWAYEHSRYDPFKHEIRHYLADGDREENYIFREFIDKGCPDIHVYKQIISLPYENIEDCIIYMWLDH